jgi:hypothetical protein
MTGEVTGAGTGITEVVRIGEIGIVENRKARVEAEVKATRKSESIRGKAVSQRATDGSPIEIGQLS